MTLRAAALAFAAPLLTSVPALAHHDDARRGTRISIQTGQSGFYYRTNSSDRYSKYRSHGHKGHHAYGRDYNRWGQSHYEVKRLKYDAMCACKEAIERKAYHIGFRDLDFDDDYYVRQVGRYDFVVSFDEVEFEGRYREFERRVTCDVEQTRYVKYVDGIPAPGSHHGKGYGSKKGHYGY